VRIPAQVWVIRDASADMTLANLRTSNSLIFLAPQCGLLFFKPIIWASTQRAVGRLSLATLHHWLQISFFHSTSLASQRRRRCVEGVLRDECGAGI